MVSSNAVVFDSKTRTASCRDEQALSIKNILTCVTIAKGIIDAECGATKLKQIECSITPAAKRNLIIAIKRVSMYGKSFPHIPRYDQWFNPLPDKLNLSVSRGVKIKILNPEDYGELYFELRAIKF